MFGGPPGPGPGSPGQRPISSNLYAQGTNQNCGNVITDRPTTRIRHAPGGASSICLGHEEAPQRVLQQRAPPQQQVRSLIQQGPPSPTGAVKYQQGPPSSSIGVRPAGYVASGGPAPPFATDSPVKAVFSPSGGRSVSGQVSNQHPPSPTGGGPSPLGLAGGYSGKQAQAFGARISNDSANAFATGANQNCGNVLTDRPTSRVLAPPGGKSNFVLG